MNPQQERIAQALHVQSVIDAKVTISEIVRFLSSYLIRSGARGYVLGISGGQDSTLCGKLAQLAVEDARHHSALPISFWAMHLPYGKQRDEQDVKLALSFIEPDRLVTVNMQASVDASVRALEDGLGEPLSDYHRGNVKARERMVMQYALAGSHNLLVLGTEHAAEAVTGFFTKYGDGACDLAPLVGLTKRQGRLLLQSMGAPARLYEKVPTADLEDLRPLYPDEASLGMSYEQIDDYLEGKSVDAQIAKRLEAIYVATKHKRAMPVTRFG
ncbi:MAG TPA: ammonia-dependent NAD(+) synthetase [Polyangiaceae bacterium]|nr:MAG: NH(3)-dependent NAD(+) synthetase [Deltaproteobacteria bacterium ADurb.Bin207]HNS99758.1 ammonia-dependent NAD(+) synthetase [Polyangiaceae bacterium]HNZ20841.1 ammonia-dependent NAD(+) synthetase [Polyangiaceae bacterium]HOD21414.1 ammonia-dependent NAD(+) synthetase [Polyangiaceae bacterium]HOE47523.1 ammonia-dependent NAD(+) synthetase [Polyangiaceae bacterium]